MRTTPPPNMSKANFPWSSSRKIQDEPPKTEDIRPKQGSFNFNLNLSFKESQQPSSTVDQNNSKNTDEQQQQQHKSMLSKRRRKIQQIAVSRIRSVLTALHINKSSSSNFPHLGSSPKIIGTLFGYRKGHVHFVFQRDHNTTPVFFIELATPITNLVKEMASGLVRIALECDKDQEVKRGVRRKRLLEEEVWRTFCNGKKCGFATKREIGPKEAKILKHVEPISMGAGVLPGFNGSGSGPDGELMYMRAQFERVVGSRDSEAFYMLNPDSHGAPELSIYLLRV